MEVRFAVQHVFENCTGILLLIWSLELDKIEVTCMFWVGTFMRI